MDCAIGDGLGDGMAMAVGELGPFVGTGRGKRRELAARRRGGTKPLPCSLRHLLHPRRAPPSS